MFLGRLVFVALSLSVLALPRGARAAPQEVVDSLCLSHLFAGASKLGRDTVKQLGKCHSQRLNGNLPAATDCNDETNAPWAELRARDADSLRLRTYKRCHVAAASPPATMGFASCPAPCDTSLPNISSYADVAECVICQIYATAEELAANVYGTPALPTGTQEACFSRLTRVIRHYIGARLKAQRSCRLSQDKGRLPPAVDCRTYDGTGIVGRAAALIAPGVAKCSDADLQGLDSCGSTVGDEVTCLPLEIDAATIEFFEAVY
jgi:hypothetical protein